MKIPIYTRQFEKDVKRCQKRGNDFEKFKIVLRLLLMSEPLPIRC